tara:strand:+ start:1290 stop:1505 length:216 start_codon:yes stop_codon:yes gene_type:complete
MAKLTIDETEYETDDFNEDQKNLLVEINYNASLQKQKGYEAHSLKFTSEALVKKLRETLEEKTKEKKAKPK